MAPLPQGAREERLAGASGWCQPGPVAGLVRLGDFGFGGGQSGRVDDAVFARARLALAGRTLALRGTDVAELADDFEDFAAGGEHAAALVLVGVEGVHELDFFRRVFAFAGGRVDLAAALDFGPSLALAALDGDDGVLLAAVFDPAIRLGATIEFDRSGWVLWHVAPFGREAGNSNRAVRPASVSCG